MKKFVQFLLTLFISCICLTATGACSLVNTNTAPPTPIEYTISFDVKDGSSIEPQKTETLNNAPTPTRKGYIFDGWYLDEHFLTPLTLPFSPSADTTIYAKWTRMTYQIAFRTNGGTPIDMQVLSTLEDAPIPTRKGYIFDGWYFDMALSSQVSFPLELYDDTIIYAKWIRAKYELSFDTNGGTPIGTKNISALVDAPTTTKEGYTLEGWYFDIELSSKVSFPLELYDNTTLYAKWVKTKYTVTFDTNGGSYIASEKLSVLEKAPTTNRSGYVFDGWFLDENCMTSVVFPLNVNSAMTIYAKWLKVYDTAKCKNCSIKLDFDHESYALFAITPNGFDLERLAVEGYKMKIHVSYDVYYRKDYDVLLDIGYAGSPKYEIYLMNNNGYGQIEENLSTTTTSRTRTITYTSTVADLLNQKIQLKFSTDNIQNIIYFKNIVIEYICYK